MLSRSSSYWWREERSLSRRRLGPGASSGASALGIILLNHVTFFKDFPKVFAPRLTNPLSLPATSHLFSPPLLSPVRTTKPKRRRGRRGETRTETRTEREREIAGSHRACQPFLSLGFLIGPPLENVLEQQVSGFGARSCTANWARTRWPSRDGGTVSEGQEAAPEGTRS